MSWFSLPFKKNLSEQALTYAEQLSKLERKAPKMALKSPEIKEARHFFKNLPARMKTDANIAILSRELLAYRLGIRSEYFQTNSGFQEFAEKTRLYNYLDKYNHTLKGLEGKKAIQIKCNNEYVSWENVPSDIKAFPKSEGKPQMFWKYNETGLINKDLYEWDKLEPIYTDKKNLNYRFSVCTTCIDQARLLGGDHAYVKLYDGETGQVYAAGLYSHDFRKENDPLSMKTGHLMIDVSEFWGIDIQEITVNITKEQFLAVKKQIESDKAKEHQQPFHLFEKNCTEYAARIARIVGLHLPNKAPYICFIFPRKFAKIVGAGLDKIPLLKRICLFVFGFFSNILHVILGGTKVDPKFKNVKPAIKSWKDIFDCSKINMHSPFILAHDVREEVEKWRAEKAKKYQGEIDKLSPYKNQAHIAQRIDKLHKKHSKIAYKVPNRFRCTPMPLGQAAAAV